MASIRSDICDALTARLALVGDFKYIEFDKVRLLGQDFQEFELPACQIIDLGEANVHEVRRGRKTWTIVIEMLIGPNGLTKPTQKNLWDLMEKTENKLFEDPKLGIANVIHMKLLGSATDLHLMEPLYSGRIEITVDYYQNLVGPC